MSRPILVATDLSPRCDRAVDRALLLGQQLGASVIALHVASEEDQANPRRLERLRAELKAQCGDGEAELLVEPGIDVPRVIAETASARHCAMILAGIARFNEARDYLLGTAVDELIRTSNLPLLVVKQRPRVAYRRIIAATDFSDGSAEAVEAAARLFPEARLRTLHAFHSAYEAWLDKDETSEFLQGKAEKDMAEFVARLPDPVRVRVEPRVEYGELGSALMLEMETVGADLLALGTHGRSALTHALIGSRASDLLRSLPYDALVVKSGTTA